MYLSETTIRVRYSETDQMGFVYYGNYAAYCEVARVEAIRQLGLSYKEVEAAGVIMPVLEHHSKFIAPARYDDLLRIVTTIKERPGARIRFEYDIYNQDGKLIHRGESLLVFVDKETGKPCRAPAALENALEMFFK